MLFESSSKRSTLELKSRRERKVNELSFGVDFLDHALEGIGIDDLILIGAPSGSGKTQLCCNIALANLSAGKKVHFIALEASEFEIERRLKFPIVLQLFLADPNRPKIDDRIRYASWLNGKFLKELAEYELEAQKYFESAFRDLFVLYKENQFGLNELLEAVALCSSDTDLIIIDHVHYFDFDDDNENRAIKEIAKTVRTLALEEKKPIILVAHLRKRDKANEDLVAGLDEFHGSSDLYKIATKVITISSGQMTPSGDYETFIRIPKNRTDGGVTRFIGREFFNPKKGEYEKGKYQIGWADAKRSKGFSEVDTRHYPAWGRRIPSLHSVTNAGNPRPKNYAPKMGQRAFQGVQHDD